MRNFIVTIIAVAVGSAVLSAQAPDPAKVAAGQKLYDTQKCAVCHSIKGVGGKLSTDLDGVGGKLSAVDIRKWLTTPKVMEATLAKKPVMLMSTVMAQPAHKLSDADVDALVAYMQSLK